MINLAPIGSQSSLHAGGSWISQDLSFKLLNSFTIQSRVKKKQEGIHRFLKEISPEKFGPFDSVERQIWWPRSHDNRGSSVRGDRGLDCVAIIPWSRGDQATIARWSDHDRIAIRLWSPHELSVVRWRSHNHFTIACLMQIGRSRSLHASPGKPSNLSFWFARPMEIRRSHCIHVSTGEPSIAVT